MTLQDYKIIKEWYHFMAYLKYPLKSYAMEFYS